MNSGLIIASLMMVLSLASPSAYSDEGLSYHDLVGRYTSEIISKGAPATLTMLEIDTVGAMLDLVCVTSEGDTLFNERFTLSRASFGTVGARFSRVDTDSTINLWVDVLGTGQLQGRLERFIHSPFSRSKITFRTVSSLGPVDTTPLDDLRSTFQQRQRTCSWKEGPETSPCGAATSHPTGLCLKHLESIRDE